MTNGAVVKGVEIALEPHDDEPRRVVFRFTGPRIAYEVSSFMSFSGGSADLGNPRPRGLSGRSSRDCRVAAHCRRNRPCRGDVDRAVGDRAALPGCAHPAGRRAHRRGVAHHPGDRSVRAQCGSLGRTLARPRRDGISSVPSPVSTVSDGRRSSREVRASNWVSGGSSVDSAKQIAAGPTHRRAHSMRHLRNVNSGGG